VILALRRTDLAMSVAADLSMDSGDSVGGLMRVVDVVVVLFEVNWFNRLMWRGAKTSSMERDATMIAETRLSRDIYTWGQ
jgi:hypothetical protein